MTLVKRVIPCLDIKDCRVVKGIHFNELRDTGDPIEIARRYNDDGADELTFLDITATSESHDIILPIIELVASQIFIPLTVGGGIRNTEDVRRLLNSGADKISINSQAVVNPKIVSEISSKYGSQCITVAIDAKRTINTYNNKKQQIIELPKWEVFTHGGRYATGLDVIKWAKYMVKLGAGEILLTSMDQDGTYKGFDLILIKLVSNAVSVPVIASGGVGNLNDLAMGIIDGHADAVLAASIFHYGQYTITEAKYYMAACGINVRI